VARLRSSANQRHPRSWTSSPVSARLHGHPPSADEPRHRRPGCRCQPPLETAPVERIITVSINAQERIFIGDRPIPISAARRHREGDDGRAGTQKVVYLRADENLRYGRVIAVVDKLKSAGVDQIGFAYSLPEEKARR
jgi:hypothetical protein